MTGEDIYNFIKPHIGSIYATGRSEIDCERIKNFKVFDELITLLLDDIEESIRTSKNSYENSVDMINREGNLLFKELKLRVADMDEYLYGEELK